MIIIPQWGMYQHTKEFHVVKKVYTYTVQKNIWWNLLFITFGAQKDTNWTPTSF